MNSKGRYEIRAVLGEGGMGVVYRAFDPVLNREVTLKTIRDSQDKAVLELFRRECAVLASMTHPNIVEIFDIGEVDEAGARRPYFVMPLLQGETLQQLINSSSPRLTVERSIQMIVQACRGLQAAHEQGLIHRDLKPSNIFILGDDSVKIIDFGVAHLINQRSATGVKGTVPYMAPEQLRMKQPTALSDQFSIAVVCYEMLARRHPFRGIGEEDVAQAILKHSPASISEINPAVSPAISQVVHKALAKEPYYRFSSVREFAECLQKALRGEGIDKFDPARIIPRVDRARKAFEAGDLEDASEIIGELESANYLAPEIRELRGQIDDQHRAKTTKQLLETARRRFDEGEYVRALQKVQEVLNIDPDNSDAFALKGAIETRHSATQIDEWFRLANQHIENYAFSHARQALEKVIEFKPNDSRAKTLMREVERREQEYFKLRNEKQDAYKSAVNAFNRGDLNSAINKLHHVRDLDRKAPNDTSPEQGAAFQEFYEQVRSKLDHLASREAEARRLLQTGEYSSALALCDEVLATYPNNVVLRVLRDDVELAERQEMSAYVAKVENEVGAEPDLNRKVAILEEAKQKYPTELRFDQSLQQIRSRRDWVNSIVGRARSMEDARQFSDALGQWETLRNIYPKYPGLDVEIDRINKRREQQQREDAKSHWVSQIDQALAVNNYAKAHTLVTEAAAEFPGDSELAALESQVLQAQKRAADSEAKVGEGKQLYAAGQVKAALDLLREAARLNPHNALIQSNLLETLLQEARATLNRDWRAAEPFVREALELDSGSPEARSLATLIQDRRQSDDVTAAMSQARHAQSAGNIKEAIEIVEQALATYPRENRLIQFRTSLVQNLPSKEQAARRASALVELNKLAKESEQTQSAPEMESIFAKSGAFSKYSADPEFSQTLSQIEVRYRKVRGEGTAAKKELAPPVNGPPEETTYRLLEPGEALPTELALASDSTPAANGYIRNIALALVGILVVVGLIWFALHPPGRKPGSAGASTAALSRVDVHGALAGEYTIRAADGTDVTARSLSGLPAGDYKVVARRNGFQSNEQVFTLNPAKDSPKVVQVSWQPLPTDFRLVVTPRTGGSIKFDGQEQRPDSAGEIKMPLAKGAHSLVWEMGNAGSLEMPFEVQDGVSLKPMAVRGPVFGVVAVVNGGQIAYQAINLSPTGLTKIVDGKAEPITWPGTFSVSPKTLVGFKFYAIALGEFEVNENGESAIYVHLDRQVPAGVGTPAKKPVVPTPTETVDPKAQEEQHRREAERKRAEDKQDYRRGSGLDK